MATSVTIVASESGGAAQQVAHGALGQCLEAGYRGVEVAFFHGTLDQELGQQAGVPGGATGHGVQPPEVRQHGLEALKVAIEVQSRIHF